MVNVQRGRSFVVRYLTLFGGEALGKICVMLALSYLARELGPRAFGRIELALSITVFFTLGTESGLGSYGARMMSAAPASAATIIAEIGAIRAALGVTGYLTLLAISGYFWGSSDMTPLLAIYGGTLLLTPFFTNWVFQGLRQMQWVAYGTALRATTFATLVFLTVRPHTDLRYVAFAELGGATALAAYNVVMVLGRLKVTPRLTGIAGGAARLFKATWYLGASDLAWAAGWYSPVIILGYLARWRTEDVAWLATSMRIIVALHTFVWLYFFNLLPNLTHELLQGIDAWRGLLRRSLSTSMWIACFVGLVGELFAPKIVSIVYGSNYTAAVVPFRIVIWMIPVTWFSGHFRFSLIAARRQDIEFMSSAAAAITAITLSFALGRLYGSAGAAVALLAGSIMHTIGAAIGAYLLIGRAPVGEMVLPVGACCAATMFAGIVGAFAGPVVGGTVACTAYALVALTQWDVARMKAAWQGALT